MRVLPPLPRRAPRVSRGAPWALVGLVGLLTACASAEGAELTADVAGELADGAELLAGHLERDAGCEAIAQAEAMLTRAREGQAAGEVPEDVVARVAHVADQVVSDVTCDPEPTETAPDADAATIDEPAPSETPDEAEKDKKQQEKDAKKREKEQEKQDKDEKKRKDKDDGPSGNRGSPPGQNSGNGNQGKGNG